MWREFTVTDICGREINEVFEKQDTVLDIVWQFDVEFSVGKLDDSLKVR
jgi:hypothetical protein